MAKNYTKQDYIGFNIDNNYNEMVDKIIKLVEKNNGLTSNEIADAIGEDKKIVLKVLYSSKTLKNALWQAPSYKWYLNKFRNKTIENNADNPNADKNLRNLCKYYLNCISLESSSGISTFLINKTREYIEINGLEDTFLNTAQVSAFISEHKNETIFLGYPILISKIFSRTGEPFLKQFPVFLFKIEFNSGKIELNNIPTINIDVIKKYSTSDANEAIYEQIILEKELGFDEKISNISLEEITAKLQSIRDWEWKEFIDPTHINTSIPLREITDEGIYNKTILVACEKSNFTQGLESELLSLSKMSTNDIEGTALYDWIYNKCNQTNNYHSDILEVLSLNGEQRRAIDMGLNQKITIITGPPGTGKSQVVTDLLINMAYHENSVLFSSRNNKAVDVVYSRINSQAPRPVMIRVGGNAYANTLAQLMESLLSSYSDGTNLEAYYNYKKKYEEINKERFELQNRKMSIIDMRNSVDLLEQNICKLDKEIQNSNVDHIIIETIQTKFNSYKYYRNKANPKKQNFWEKLLWDFKKEKILRNLKESAKALNESLHPYNIFVNSTIVEEDIFNNQCIKIDALLSSLRSIIDYKSKLNSLNQMPHIEDLDYLVFKKELSLSSIAKSLWKEWLQNRNTNISSEDRQLMTDYCAAIKLKNDSSLEDDPQLSKNFNSLQEKVKKFFPCWSVTSLSTKGRIPFQKGLFDLLIIDEASQCDIASIIPLLYRARRTVIIGDPKQLQHISSISPKQDNALITKYEIPYKWSYAVSSLYNLASSLVDSNQIIQLKDHHRCCADIIEFSNQEFYDEKLRVATDYSKLKVPDGYELGIKWINVLGKTVRPSTGSCYNLAEVEAILKELKTIIESDFNGSIGIVTPFRAQVEKFKSAIEKDSVLLQNIAKFDILTDTVHKFQGDERDVILFSPVISQGTPNGAINFLNQTSNLFNVAITRARAVLIIAGDIDYCSDSEVGYFKHFVDYYNKIKSDNLTSSSKSLIEYGQTREYPHVNNEEQVSEWEKELYTALFDAGIQTIPQYSEDKYKLDLAIILGDKKLDIEVDGEMYHRAWNGELAYRDQLRNQRLFELGWDVKRFWVYRIRDDIQGCVEEIKKWVNQNKLEEK